jgi:hypothetical protein
MLDEVCPGKVLRLMAGDVADWHDDLDVDTHVWNQLLRPWDVLTGASTCTRETIVDACRRSGVVDPYTSGWISPRPATAPAPVTSTPELVHGVQVCSPFMAAAMRRLGVFSGKKIKSWA